MQQIGNLAKKRINIILKGFDPVSSGGFTQLPNYILRKKDLSAGAKIIYALLLSYAWQKDNTFIGQQTFMNDLGISKPTIIKLLKELVKTKFLKIKRRGQGKTNLYFLYCRVKSQK